MATDLPSRSENVTRNMIYGRPLAPQGVAIGVDEGAVSFRSIEGNGYHSRVAIRLCSTHLRHLSWVRILPQLMLQFLPIDDLSCCHVSMWILDVSLSGHQSWSSGFKSRTRMCATSIRSVVTSFHSSTLSFAEAMFMVDIAATFRLVCRRVGRRTDEPRDLQQNFFAKKSSSSFAGQNTRLGENW